MDRSKLPKMTPGKVVPTPWWKPKAAPKKRMPKAGPKMPRDTQPEAVDDSAVRRIKKRNDALREAAGD